jgi:hypothetical protein
MRRLGYLEEGSSCLEDHLPILSSPCLCMVVVLFGKEVRDVFGGC